MQEAVTNVRTAYCKKEDQRKGEILEEARERKEMIGVDDKSTKERWGSWEMEGRQLGDGGKQLGEVGGGEAAGTGRGGSWDRRGR